MKKPAAFLLVTVLAIFLVGALALSQGILQPGTKPKGDLPPAEERINPDPSSPNKISLGEVDPGTAVKIAGVELESEGYLVVYKDSSGKKVQAGRSQLLTAGMHSNITIATQSLKDGDVIYVTLENKSGTQIKDANGNPIEVFKNVGMAMGHYDPSEY